MDLSLHKVNSLLDHDQIEVKKREELRKWGDDSWEGDGAVHVFNMNRG